MTTIAELLKESGKKTAPYVTCLVRGKPIKLTSEEAVRQLYVMVLRDDLGYPVSRMDVEHGKPGSARPSSSTPPSAPSKSPSRIPKSSR